MPGTVDNAAFVAGAARVSTYSLHEYTQVKHVALDRTGQSRKAWQPHGLRGPRALTDTRPP